MTALRSAVAGMEGKLEGITARAPFNGIIERVEAPEGVAFKEDAVGGITGWWAKPAETREGSAILHLHGGWFNWGTAQAFCNLAGHIALKGAAYANPLSHKLAESFVFILRMVAEATISFSGCPCAWHRPTSNQGE
jgi:hypothetical protein